MKTVQAEKFVGADDRIHRVWRVVGNDTTPIHKMHPYGRDRKCDLCYFGFAHSQAAHNAEINR